MNRKKWWIILAVLVVLAGTAYVFRDSLPFGTQATARARQAAVEQENTVAIRPATDVSQVSAAGNIELADERALVLQVEGIVSRVAVEAGDEVSKGDLILALDDSDLQRAVKQAELSLAEAQNQLAQLKEPADQTKIDAAWASLAAAKAKLADLQDGPTQAELDAAQASLEAAQASYQELVDGPSEAELTKLAASLNKAQIALKQAQLAYDEIAYRDDKGQSQQAQNLQEATIDFDVAKAEFQIATEPASEAELKEALSKIYSAQVQLDDLQASEAELASAQADVASAQANLTDLLNGPSELEIEAAEINIAQAELSLEEARENLAHAEVRAPMDGVVTDVAVEAGQKVSAGTQVAAVADMSALELTVNVAEVDIPKVQVGMPVDITIDALPDRVFHGEVSRITPVSTSDSGVVNYPVTIRLTDEDLSAVRPGMTAVATIRGEAGQTRWLVPTSSVVEFEGQKSVMVVRGDSRPQRVSVTPVGVEGEWTVVESPDLQDGDRVIGEVTSFAGQENSNQPRGPFGPPPR